MSVSSLLGTVPKEDLIKNSPTIKGIPAAIPPHMRDRRASKLNEPQTEFGSFYFRNLSALDKANKDAINRLKNEHMIEFPNSHRRTSSTSVISSPSDATTSKLRATKYSITGSPIIGGTAKATGRSDSSSIRSFSPERGFSIDPTNVNRSRKGSIGGLVNNSNNMLLFNDSDVPKFKSPLSPSNTTASLAPLSSHPKLLSKSIFQRANSSELSVDESDRLQAVATVNSLRYRRESGRGSSGAGIGSTGIGYHMDILLCEPIPIHRYRMKKDLESLGCTVLTAGAADELISRADGQIKFDLIMTPLRLPKVGSSDIIKLLKRANGANSTTPIVAVTNYYQEAMASGVFDDVMEKPISIKELRKLIAKYALKKSQQEEDTLFSDYDEIQMSH